MRFSQRAQAYLLFSAWAAACACIQLNTDDRHGARSGGSTGRSGSTGAGTGGVLETNAGREGAGGPNVGGSSSGSGGSSGMQGGTSSAGAGASTGDDCEVDSPDQLASPKSLNLSGSLGVHDPAVISAHGQYYLFHTSLSDTRPGIWAKTSADLLSWSEAEDVFASIPAWVADQVPGVKNLWAPDISYFSDSYHLYYSASTFGSDRSCIGHATRDALDTGTWDDHGPVICSNTDSGEREDWNAIDPNLILDQDGTPWLAFGSFWSGIQMIELDKDGARANQEIHTLATRTANGGSLEAPFIVRRCDNYYLFLSFDLCCRGSQSTYRIMVGRSPNLLGPYQDRVGNSLLEGGGTVVLQGDARWHGPGHNAVLLEGAKAYNVYHAYDTRHAGAPSLRISELAWDTSGWPVSAGP